MDKKFNRKKIENQSDDFLEYLKNSISDSAFLFLSKISKETELFIFSGIIRNYFLNYKGGIRDLDIVINHENDEIRRIIEHYEYKRNSFGGFKFVIESLPVDLWELNKTWALANNKIKQTLFNDINLPKTSFFNFSSVVYDFNKRKFIFNKDFEKFINTREIDLVLEQNPLPQLCIVNTIYYKEKFHLGIAKNLKLYIVKNFENYSEEDYLLIQKKHFGRVKYSYPFLKTYFKIFKDDVESPVKNKIVRKRNLYTKDEIILCTYIAKFGKREFDENDIHKLKNRSISSIKMKVQNIAAMLDEERFETNDNISKLTGKAPEEKGRRTNWDIVCNLTSIPKKEFLSKCQKLLEFV